MKPKVLVTGANGQLGQTINELYGFDSTFNIYFAEKREFDVTNVEGMDSFLKNHQFDFCINCAAYTNVEKSETNPNLAFEVNAEGVKNLAQQCRAHGIILIHISTDYVFDGTKKVPYSEHDLPNPINQYGKSKLAGEKHIQAILERYFIIRTSWLYSKYGNNFLKTIIKKIENNEPLQIITSQRGTPTSCHDLAEFIFHLLKQKNPIFGIYHFSALGETSWYEYALQICEHFMQYDCKKIESTETYTSVAERPEYSVLNNSKARLVFKKDFLWRESVNSTIKALLKE